MWFLAIFFVKQVNRGTHLIGSLLELLEQVIGDVGSVIGVDQSERVQATSLRVSGGSGGHFARQVRRHQRQRLLLVAAMDDSERSRRRQLGPVGRPRQPIQIIPKKKKKKVNNKLSINHSAATLCKLSRKNQKPKKKKKIILQIKLNFCKSISSGSAKQTYKFKSTWNRISGLIPAGIDLMPGLRLISETGNQSSANKNKKKTRITMRNVKFPNGEQA